jgi:iron complex outermembrane receptor protein
MPVRIPAGFSRACILAWCLTLTLKPGAASPPSAPADPVMLRDLSLEELSRIEVTSPSKEPRPAFQSPVAVYVITGDQIRRSGATSIPEVLRQAPGVEVARIDGNKWSIAIRGFGSRLSRSVLVLMDGRTVYTTFFAGTYWEVQDTVMEDIERIEIIRGPGGTIWGPNAVNGVINIITKNARDTHGTLVSVGSGNEEQGFVNFRYGAGNGKNLHYRIYGKGFTRSPEVHADGKNFDDWRSEQTGFRLDWSRPDLGTPERDSLTIQGDLYKEEAGERVEATSYTQPYKRTIDGNAQLSGGNIMARWKRVLKSGGNIQLQTYYDRTNRHEPNFGELRDTFDIDYLQQAPVGTRQRVSWGAGVRLSVGNALQVVSGLTFDPPKRTDQIYTAFLQDEITLVENRLALILGTKLLRTNYTGVLPEPSARLLWTPDTKQTVWAAFTHAVRTPSRVEEDFNLSGYIGSTDTGTPFFARFNANNHFASEQLNGYEVGYRRLLGKGLYLGVASFLNHYHDLLSEEITGGVYPESTPAPAHLLLPAQFRNGLLGYSVGGEVSPEWRPTEFWSLRGSYSYLNIDLKMAPRAADVGTIPGIEGASPQHQVGIQSAFDLPKRFTLDLAFRYISALRNPAVPSYSTGDVRLAWRARPSLEISVVGQNLLQPSHPEFAGDPGPLVGIRRSVYGKLTWTQ